MKRRWSSHLENGWDGDDGLERAGEFVDAYTALLGRSQRRAAGAQPEGGRGRPRVS